MSRADTHLGDAVATGRASEAVFDELYKDEVVKKGLAEQLAGVDPADAGCFGGEGAFLPSLTSALRFEIRAVARVA